MKDKKLENFRKIGEQIVAKPGENNFETLKNLLETPKIQLAKTPTETAKSVLTKSGVIEKYF